MDGNGWEDGTAGAQSKVGEGHAKSLGSRKRLVRTDVSDKIEGCVSLAIRETTSSNPKSGR